MGIGLTAVVHSAATQLNFVASFLLHDARRRGWRGYRATLIVTSGGPDALLAFWMLVVVGAVVGAVTGWFGAATAHYFHGTKSA